MKNGCDLKTPLLTLGALCGGLGVAISQSAWAYETPSVRMDELMITAERHTVMTRGHHRRIATTGQAQLRADQPDSVAQAVVNEPNVSVAGGPRAASQSVNIRGLSGNKVLQTVDGVRQMFTSGHRPSYFIDPALLEQVDVVKGPASSLWGSGALGGVVAQRTLSTHSVLEADQQLGGFIRGGFNTNNDDTQSTALLAGRTDSADWLLGVYQHSANDLEMGNGQALENSGSDDRGLLLRWDQAVTDDLDIRLNLQQGEREGGVPSNAAAGLSRSNFLLQRDSQNRIASVSANYRPGSNLVNSHSRLYWTNTDIKEARVSDGRADRTELEGYGAEFSNRSVLGNLSLVYGLDTYREEFSAQRSGADRPTPPDATSDLAGAYLQSELALSDSWKLVLAGRYDYFATEAENLNQDRSDTAFSPSAAISWQAQPNLQLTLRHDRAFRAPSAEELYSTGTHFCMGPGFCNTFIANPDLKAEKAANTELIANWAVLESAQQSWNISASVFENRVDNFIEQQVDRPVFVPIPNAGNTTYRNVNEATLRGFEFNSTYQLGRFELALGYGQTRGSDDASGDPLSGIPADSIKARAQYAWLGGNLITGAKLTHAQSQGRTTDGEDYQGYTLTDLYASWTPAALPQLELELTVNNLTDLYYRQAWAQLYEPGREVVASATYRF